LVQAYTPGLLKITTVKTYWLPVYEYQWSCCRWLHRLELLRQAQEKDGNSGH